MLKTMKKSICVFSFLVMTLSCTNSVHAETKAGWVNENGSYSYIYADSTRAKGMKKIDGLTYYMNESGIMQTGWIWNDNNWYYATPGGALATGWIQLDGAWYCFRANGVMITQGWKTVGESKYYFNENGAISTNQYIGKYYVNKDGAYTERFDIQKQKAEKGKKVRNPSNEEYLAAADGLNSIPKVILGYVVDNGWSVVCVTEEGTTGQTTMGYDELFYEVVFNQSKKEIQVWGKEYALLSSMEFFEKINNISSKYEVPLKETMDLTMEEEFDMTRETVRLYWIEHTIRYLESERRDELKAENPALYTLIEAIATEYKLQE